MLLSLKLLICFHKKIIKISGCEILWMPAEIYGSWLFIFVEKEFEKSDITDLFRGNQSNLCPVHFVHLFTTGVMFLPYSEENLHN